MSNEDLELIHQIENDEFYKYFLQSNVKSDLSTSLSITEQVKKLGEAIELLNKELQKQVLDKHNDLVRQGHHATKLENALASMHVHVQNLLANAERLRNQIQGPYEALEKHTKVLERLHIASHILRKVNRIQQLGKRLCNVNDPIQKAVVLQELEQLAADENLEGIDAVTSELRNIRTQQQKVVQLATGSLNQGIFNENTAQTTTALQIFINLGTIASVLQTQIDSALLDCKKSLKNAFEVGSDISIKSKVGPGRTALTSSQGFRVRVWVELEKAFGEEIFQQCKQVKFLQFTYDNLNACADNPVAAKFWADLSLMIKEEINKASPAVQQMLEEDYPRLLKAYCEITKKLNYKPFEFNRHVLEKCENSYLSTSLRKILEPTEAIFAAENNLPTNDEIDKLVRIISSDLSVALIEENLSEKIAKNVSKCIKLFAVKSEQQIETGPEAAQVIGGSANTGQQKNVQLANSLYYFQTQINRILFNMKDSLSVKAVSVVKESLQNLDNLTVMILQPLIVSINSAIETVIVTIHLETDWAKLHVSNIKHLSCSPYMRELNQFVNRVYNTYLSSFDNKEVLSTKCNEIAVRCIELLVRHTSLLRPVSQGGRLRLQADFAQLETILKTLSPNLIDLGRPYKLLKSVASLITLSAEEIVRSYTEGSVVPPSTILFMLFSFAGSDLASPHQNTGWSLPKISAWLDEHVSEADRLDLVAGAVQRYEALVRKKNSESYDPIYPIISQFLEEALKSLI